MSIQFHLDLNKAPCLKMSYRNDLLETCGSIYYIPKIFRTRPGSRQGSNKVNYHSSEWFIKSRNGRSMSLEFCCERFLLNDACGRIYSIQYQNSYDQNFF